MTKPEPEFFSTDDPVCDFCSQKPVVWAYPTKDSFLTGGVLALGSKTKPDKMVTMTSYGWWAACQTCHELIQKGERDTLAQRSADLMDNPLPMKIRMIAIKQAHGAFFDNRTDQPPILHDISRVPFVDADNEEDVYCHEHVPHKRMRAWHTRRSTCKTCNRELGYDPEGAS